MQRNISVLLGNIVVHQRVTGQNLTLKVHFVWTQCQWGKKENTHNHHPLYDANVVSTLRVKSSPKYKNKLRFQHRKWDHPSRAWQYYSVMTNISTKKLLWWIRHPDDFLQRYMTCWGKSWSTGQWHSKLKGYEGGLVSHDTELVKSI